MVGPWALSVLTGVEMLEDASLRQASLQSNGQRHSDQQADLGMDGQTKNQLPRKDESMQ